MAVGRKTLRPYRRYSQGGLSNVSFLAVPSGAGRPVKVHRVGYTGGNSNSHVVLQMFTTAGSPTFTSGTPHDPQDPATSIAGVVNYTSPGGGQGALIREFCTQGATFFARGSTLTVEFGDNPIVINPGENLQAEWTSNCTTWWEWSE